MFQECMFLNFQYRECDSQELLLHTLLEIIVILVMPSSLCLTFYFQSLHNKNNAYNLNVEIQNTSTKQLDSGNRDDCISSL